MSQGIEALCKAAKNSELLREFVEKNRADAAELAKNIFTLLAKPTSEEPTKKHKTVDVKEELNDDAMDTIPSSSAMATVCAKKKFTLTLRGSRNYLA